MCVGSIKNDVIANYTFLYHHGKIASTRTFIDPSFGGGGGSLSGLCVCFEAPPGDTMTLWNIIAVY